MINIDREIADFTASVLIRYFRVGARVDSIQPRLNATTDLELLRLHWSISEPVRALIAYLLNHRHEIQSLLNFHLRTDDAIVRGRLDARATVLHRMRSGHATAVISHEPVRSFDTGPNHVLIWVLEQASTFAMKVLHWHSGSSAYGTVAETVMADLARVRRFDIFREAVKLPSTRRRPSPGALLAAKRSRRSAYHFAVEAYRLLSDLETGDEAAIERVVRSTLVAPLENWRTFELAVCLAAAEALEVATGQKMSLSILHSNGGTPIASIGRFDVHWQRLTSLYSAPPLEKSEERVKAILAGFGLNTGTERPDLVVVDRDQGKVVSVLEVKYLAGDTAIARFHEAVEQIVRYTRGYAQASSINELTSNSVIVLLHSSPSVLSTAVSVPMAVDFDAIKRQQLSIWAKRLNSPPPLCPPLL